MALAGAHDQVGGCRRSNGDRPRAGDRAVGGVAVTVTVWGPAVTKVAEFPKVWVPLSPEVNVSSAGSTTPAPASVVVKCTVPR